MLYASTKRNIKKATLLKKSMMAMYMGMKKKNLRRSTNMGISIET